MTRGLSRLLARLGAERVTTEAVDGGEAPEVLARHLAPLLQRALRERRAAGGEADEDEDAPADDAAGLVELFNRAVALVGEEEEGLDGPPALLTAVLPPPAGGPGEARAPDRPGVPLSTSALLVNARDEHRVGVELARELASADGVDLVCSFVKWSGLRLLEPALRELRARGAPLRVLTTAYLGATDGRALDALCRLGAEVRVSYDTRRTRLHAKAWLLRRRTGYTTAFIGSSNLSSAALLDGLEWNVRLSAVETPHLVEKFAATFEGYWGDPEFEPYEADRDRPRFEAAVRAERQADDGDALPAGWAPLEVRPYPHQQEILDRLEAERDLHGSFRNLVVAATGTGKTIVAALDYRRARERHGADRLLFVAHRREILNQSLATFRAVLGDGSFGERWVEGERPTAGKHVFASIQSLHRFDPGRLAPDAFDYVVVDEFHHAEAPSYARLLEHLRPKVLLGLTATPERADGTDVRRWFGGRVAAELRLWRALERGLLCPFQYFGHHDGTDLSRLPWARSGYDAAALEGVLTGNDLRDRLVLAAVADKVPDPRRMRALGFCAGVAHAHHLARVFAAEGIPAVAVDASTPREEREEALRRLRDREVNVVFAVDLFNEGVDVPQVDTVLFLRPTESVTVFLQQLGRGLRLAPDKPCLTVLDFVGQAHRSFRFDLRFRALTGASRGEVMALIERGFPVLPPGCAIHLDRVAAEVVLDNVKAALGQGPARLARELVDVARRLGRPPTLTEFLDDAQLELEDVYARREHGWTATRRRAAALAPDVVAVPAAGPDEPRLARMLPGLLHLDDPERLALLRRLVLDPDPPAVASLSAREQRVAGMLHTDFWKRGPDLPADLDEGLARLRAEPAVREELDQLLRALEARADHVTHPVDGLPAEVPVRLHARYTTDEVLAAFGRVQPGSTFRLQAGVLYDQATQTDLFFPTIQKSARDYSPRTMYRDFALAPDLFHWESQSTTRAASGTGQRYQRHRELGSRVLLFVRRRKQDDRKLAEAYTCLGLVDYVRHEGERPMAITWRLRVPMPATVFAAVRVAAA